MLNRMTTIVTMRDGTPNTGRIEGDVRPGLPGITLIGFNGDVPAARDEVHDVLTTLGLRIPQRRIVLHGVPAIAPMPAELYVSVIAAVIAGCVNHDFRGRDVVAVPDTLDSDQAQQLASFGHAITFPTTDHPEAVVALIQGAAARIGKTPF